MHNCFPVIPWQHESNREQFEEKTNSRKSLPDLRNMSIQQLLFEIVCFPYIFLKILVMHWTRLISLKGLEFLLLFIVKKPDRKITNKHNIFSIPPFLHPAFPFAISNKIFLLITTTMHFYWTLNIFMKNKILMNWFQVFFFFLHRLVLLKELSQDFLLNASICGRKGCIVTAERIETIKCNVTIKCYY